MKGLRNFWLVFLMVNSSFLIPAHGQVKDLQPFIYCNIDSLISETDSLRFQLYPATYHSLYMLLDPTENGGWPPIPFMPDVFADLVTYPDSGRLGIQYGNFQAQLLSFYDYGGVHFSQIHLAEASRKETDAGGEVHYPEDDMLTITLAYSFGRAWIRFDKEAESDNWLETFVENGMQTFGPEIASIRKGSPEVKWLRMFAELSEKIRVLSR